MATNTEIVPANVQRGGTIFTGKNRYKDQCFPYHPAGLLTIKKNKPTNGRFFNFILKRTTKEKVPGGE